MIIKDFENNINVSQKVKGLLFYGQNSGLISYFVNKLLGYDKNFNNVTRFDVGEFSTIELETSLNSGGLNLFQERELKIFYNIGNKHAKILKSYFTNAGNEYGFVIFIADELDSKSSLRSLFEKDDVLAAIPCYLDDEVTTLKIINQFNNDNDLGLSSDVRSMLSHQINGDRLNTINELEKLYLYKKGGYLLTGDAIDALVIETDTVKLQDLIDAIFLQNNVLALDLFHKVMVSDDIHVIGIIRAMISWLLVLKEIKKAPLSDQDALLRRYGVFFKRTSIVKKQLNLSYDLIVQYINRLNDIEIAVKRYGNDIAANLFTVFIQSGI